MTWIAIPLALACVDRAQAQETAPARSGVTITWDERPSIHFGRIARVDLRATLQLDGRDSDVLIDRDDPAVAWARKRVGISGVVGGMFGLQVEREIGGPWRDVYINYEQFDAVQIRAGQFKVPFSLDQTTSAAHLDFVYRSRAAQTMAPGRDRGVMVHGDLWRKAIAYQVGAFAHDGLSDRPPDPDRVSGGRSIAARVTARPFRSAGLSRSVEFGAAGVWTDVPEGLTSLQGETTVGRDFYEPGLWVRGRQYRSGIEARWRPGPVGISAEYLRLTAERRGQSVEDTDLSPFLVSGWYVAGSWVLTGERKSRGPENPDRPLPRGPGAIEAAARVEALEFSSRARDGEPSTSPRADVVLGNRLQAVTLGINWFPIRWVRVQFNLIREALADPLQGPLPERQAFWNNVVRLQFHW